MDVSNGLRHKKEARCDIVWFGWHVIMCSCVPSAGAGDALFVFTE